MAEVALYGFTNMSRGEAELVLNREDFTREFRVVAVKVPAKRTRFVRVFSTLSSSQPIRALKT